MLGTCSLAMSVTPLQKQARAMHRTAPIYDLAESVTQESPLGVSLGRGRGNVQMPRATAQSRVGSSYQCVMFSAFAIVLTFAIAVTVRSTTM